MDEPRAMLKKAEVLLTRNDIPGAVALYTSVAHFYAAQGFALKAVAVWKQVLAIAEKHHNRAFDADARVQLITLETDARALEEG